MRTLHLSNSGWNTAIVDGETWPPKEKGMTARAGCRARPADHDLQIVCAASTFAWRTTPRQCRMLGFLKYIRDCALLRRECRGEPNRKEKACMHSVWFGEFMGTLVLVLLGNGVNAGVTLRKSYAADAGWMVVTTGMGAGRDVRRAGGAGLRQPGRAPESGDHAGERGGQRRLLATGKLLVGTGAGRDGRRIADGAALCAALGADSGSGMRSCGVFCTTAAVRNPLANFISEVIGTMMLVVVAGAIFSHGVSTTGPARGAWAVAGGQPGVGHRALAGRHDGLCHQSGAGSWARGSRMPCFPFPARADRKWSYAPIPDHWAAAGGALAGLLLRSRTSGEARFRRPRS